MQVPGEYASDAVHLLREEGPAVGAGLQDEGSFLGAMLHSDRGEWIKSIVNQRVGGYFILRIQSFICICV